MMRLLLQDCLYLGTTQKQVSLPVEPAPEPLSQMCFEVILAPALPGGPHADEPELCQGPLMALEKIWTHVSGCVQEESKKSGSAGGTCWQITGRAALTLIWKLEIGSKLEAVD